MNYIEIDLGSKTPPFEQIKASIVELISAGTLRLHHKLPTIRQLAGDLGVAPNTVARAYRELEVDGFLLSRGRRGTIVLEPPESAPSAVLDKLSGAVRSAQDAGFGNAEILTHVARTLDR